MAEITMAERAMPALAPESQAAIDFAISNQITFCAGNAKLHRLATSMEYVERVGIPGRVVEVGVAMGGSAIVLAHAKSPSRPLDLYDVFTLLPPPTAEDGDKAAQVYEYFLKSAPSNMRDRKYQAHASDLEMFVRANLAQSGIEIDRRSVSLVKGDVKDTLAPTGPVALFHIDCDWVEPMRICLARTADLISPAGLIVFDDYSSFSGCRSLIDAWLASRPEFVVVNNSWSLVAQRSPSDPALKAMLRRFDPVVHAARGGS
ncbi:MAG TPA: TylF/MycF/NovP-related O-methyltransferase [Dongiaceae bacterium]|jgi:predicted O-methyltransferase YrrM|nr:TylF/MycF/NovP-related O-methyltransferase [Dongiaceae bacterium]